MEKDDNFKSKVLNQIEGTMFFYAPEMCIEDHTEFQGKPLDVWALGITLYLLIYRKLPFDNDEGNMIDILDQIAEAK